MSWDETHSTGDRARLALESAARQARAIVADADRTGDDAIRRVLEEAAGDRAARREALSRARAEVAERAARSESELRRLAAILRDTSDLGLTGSRS